MNCKKRKKKWIVKVPVWASVTEQKPWVSEKGHFALTRDCSLRTPLARYMGLYRCIRIYRSEWGQEEVGESLPRCCRPRGGEQQPLGKDTKVPSPLSRKRVKLKAKGSKSYAWGQSTRFTVAGESGGREKENHPVPWRRAGNYPGLSPLGVS